MLPAFQAALPVLFGGLSAAVFTFWLQGTRTKRDVAVKMVEQFSSLEAHQYRAKCWMLFARVPNARSFDELDDCSNDLEEREIFRYVLSFFVQAGGLLENRLMNENVFFALTQRWCREILDKHLRRMAEGTTADHYVVHAKMVRLLGIRWDQWQRRPRSLWIFG